MTAPIYLDNGAMTAPSDYVIEQMLPFFKRYWLPEKASYQCGKEPFASLNRSAKTLRALLGALPEDQIIFTSSAASGLERIARAAYLNRSIAKGCNHFLTTKSEELKLQEGLNLWNQAGCVVKEIPLNQAGQVTADALQASLSPRTALVSLAWANGLTGVIHPIVELAEVCQKEGVWLHVDVSHILGKVYFQWRDLPIDYITFDGDRLHGPRGSGALLIRGKKGVSGLTSDELNPAAILGLGAACQEAIDHFDHLALETARLRNAFEKEVSAGCGARVLFEDAERVPHLSVLSFPNVFLEHLAFCLKEEGIYASIGGVRYPPLMRVLTSLGIDIDSARGALSFGLSRITTEEEIKRAAGTIVDCANRCRKLSKELVT